LSRVGVVILSGLFWLWTGVKLLPDLFGWTTLPEDARTSLTLVERGVLWLLSTPWWVPGLLATSLAVALIWMMRSKPDRVREVIHYISEPDIPHIVRDFVVAADCTKFWQDSGRVTFLFPRKLRCTPTVATPSGFSDKYAPETYDEFSCTFRPLKGTNWAENREYVKTASIYFDALSEDQCRALSHRLGVDDNDQPNMGDTLSSILSDRMKGMPYLLKLIGEGTGTASPRAT
jgi:hypothetical protein